jgi:hypothetical protein
MRRGRQVLIIVGWVALGIWAALEFYVRITNRWGAFGVAATYLPMLLLSAMLAGLGTVMCLASLWHRRWDAPLAVVTFLHGWIVWYAATHT